MAEVSVLIPNKDYSGYIGQCIESVLNQTYKDFEVIVCDDNSTDDSVEVIKKYPVKLILKRDKIPNIANTLNTLLENAKGKYIAILSSDDYWEPNFLEIMMKNLKEQKVKGVYCNQYAVDSIGNRTGETIYPDAKTQLELHQISMGKNNMNYPVCVLGQGCTLIDKEIFDDIGFYNPEIRHGEETEWGARATNYYYFYHIDNLLKYKRIHSRNESNVYVNDNKIKIQLVKKIKQSVLDWKSRRRIRFGLIGCGRVSRKHIDAIKKIPGAEIVSVCDIVEEKAKKLADEIGCRPYTDYKEFLKSSMEVVNICTPPSTHAKIVEDVATSRRNIVCEKPISVRMSEAKKMVDVCKKFGVRLFVVKQNRYNLPIIKLKEAINQKRLGDLLFLSIIVRWSRNQDYYDRDNGWRSEKNGGGGVILNQSSHHIDMLNYLGGEIESVNCIKKTFVHNIEVEDGSVAIFKFKNGAFGTYEGTTCTYPKDLEGSISVLGKKGSVKIGGFAMNKVEFWEFKEESPKDKEMKHMITNPPNVYGFGHSDLLKDIVNCLRNNRESLLEGDKMIESLRIMMAMQKSAKENREVLISEIKDEDEKYYT